MRLFVTKLAHVATLPMPAKRWTVEQAGYKEQSHPGQ